MSADRTAAGAQGALLLAWALPLLSRALREGGLAALVITAVVMLVSVMAPFAALPAGRWQRVTERGLPVLVAAAALGLAVSAGGPPALGLALLIWLFAPSLPADPRVPVALAVVGLALLLGGAVSGTPYWGWTLLAPRWSMSWTAMAAASLMGGLGLGVGQPQPRGSAALLASLLVAAMVLALVWEQDPQALPATVGGPQGVLGAALCAGAAAGPSLRGARRPTPVALLGAALTAWFALTPTALPTLLTLAPLAAGLSRLIDRQFPTGAALVALGLLAWPGLPSGLGGAAAVAFTAGALVWWVGLAGLGEEA